MAHEIAERLLKRYEHMVEHRSLWEKEWEDIADYVLPRKSFMLRGLTTGSRVATKLYSSAAIKANEDLASTIQGTLTNAAIRWFKLRFPLIDLNDDPSASEWIETVSNTMFEAIQQSNFDAALNESYLDIGAFGTACTFVDWDNERDKLRFKTLTIGGYAISEDKGERIDTVGRRFKMTARAMKQKWSEGKLPENILKRIEANQLEEQFEVLHMVGPREDHTIDPRRERVDPLQRKWGEFYVAIDGKVILSEGGFHEFPYLVPRWSKNSGEFYGRGPGHIALPDIKTLNRARQLKFRQWAKTIDPPMQALEDAAIGQIRLAPSSLNFVKEKDAITPIETGGKFDVARVNELELVQAIKEVFFSDLVNLPPVQGTPMSATEAAQRFELMERKLGPVVGRLKSEMLEPMIDRVFGLMARKGLLPPPPPLVIQTFREAGTDLQVEFEGPLERAQRMSDLVSVERFYATVAPIAAVRPEVLDVPDHDAITRFVAKTVGLPAHFINPPELVEEARQARAEAEQAAIQAEQAKTLADAAKSGAQAGATLAESGIAEGI